MTGVALSTRGVAVAFGGVRAVDGVNLDVAPGELLAVIGPNGAGKTTFFEILSGFVTPDSGTVMLDGQDVTRLSPHQRSRLGLVRGFQDARMFPALTVADVLRIALDKQVADAVDVPGMLLGLRSARRVERWLDGKVDELVTSFGLGRYRESAVGELSTGTRRIVEIAGLFAQQPRLVLLDEPTAGIAAKETEALTELLRSLQASTGVTLVLIEHDIPLVMSLAHRVCVLEAGTLLVEGPPREVAEDPRVLEAYFGSRRPVSTGGST